MKKYLKLGALLLAVALLLSMAACGSAPPQEVLPDIDINIIDTPTAAPSPTAAPEPSTAPSAEPTAEPDPTPDPTPEPAPKLDEDGYYYDVESVALYITQYGKLPSNYITKNEARDLGWEGGTPEQFKPGSAIGGDYFGNYEGLLPKAQGRKWTECDIDTNGKNSRGAKRLIFSNDGLFYYTDDHYESYTQLVVTEEGTIEWK
jgi:predicted small lipoprotein YifL